MPEGTENVHRVAPVGLNATTMESYATYVVLSESTVTPDATEMVPFEKNVETDADGGPANDAARVLLKLGGQ